MIYSKAKRSKYIGKFLVGDRFGSWEVMDEEILMDDRSRAYVMCKCSICKRLQAVDCHHLLGRSTRKCKQCDLTFSQRHGYKNSNYSKTIPSVIKKEYIALGVEIEDAKALELFRYQEEKCWLTGVYISLHSDLFGTNSYSARLIPWNPALSPKNLNNVMWVDKRVARAKDCMEHGMFIRMCNTVSDFKIRVDKDK